jgi:hypothetical protein
MTDDTNIFTKEELESAQPRVAPDLPPAGHARDEELRRREDNLQKAAETVHTEREAIDPAALEEDYDVQSLLRRGDGLTVSDPQPGFVYCWVYSGTRTLARVWEKKRLGWEVVQGDDPEAREFKVEDGTRRLADVTLMRIRMDRHLALEMYEEEKRLRQQLGIDAELRDIADRNPDKLRYYDHENNPYARRMEANAATRTAARRTAMKHVDSMLRRGNVPGVPSPGKGGG